MRAAWDNSQEQPASLFSLHFTLPSCWPGAWPPLPCPWTQVGSWDMALSVSFLTAPARLAVLGAGGRKARPDLLHSVCRGLLGLLAVLHRCPCAILTMRLCCALPMGSQAVPLTPLLHPRSPAGWLQHRCLQAVLDTLAVYPCSSLLDLASF